MMKETDIALLLFQVSENILKKVKKLKYLRKKHFPENIKKKAGES